LERAIASIQARRADLGDAVVNAAVAALREKLERMEPPVRGQRRQVTALVADVAGFTALSGHFEAGPLRDLVDALWQRLDAVVSGYAGTVYQHVGDALVALWGAPAAHEDDSEQAVRAALALQEQV
jgi:class 3 adenylate cyclase